MSLEAKVQQIESNQQSLDHAMRDLMKVVAGNHDVVTLILNEQRDTKKIVDALAVRVYEHDRRFDKIDQQFVNINQRFNKIEDILIQIIGRLPD